MSATLKFTNNQSTNTMALSEDITQAVALFHEGSSFLHAVATGPPTGDASTVTNPVDFTEQITVARAIQEVTDTGGFLTIDSIQTATGKKTFTGGLFKTASGDSLLDVVNDKTLVPNIDEAVMVSVLATPVIFPWTKFTKTAGSTCSYTAGMAHDELTPNVSTTDQAITPSGSEAIGEGFVMEGMIYKLGSLSCKYATTGPRRICATNLSPVFSTAHTLDGDGWLMLSPFLANGTDARDPALAYTTANGMAWGVQMKTSKLNTMVIRVFGFTNGGGVVFSPWTSNINVANRQVPSRMVMIENYVSPTETVVEAAFYRKGWSFAEPSVKAPYAKTDPISLDPTGLSGAYQIKPTFISTNNKAAAVLNGTYILGEFETY